MEQHRHCAPADGGWTMAPPPWLGRRRSVSLAVALPALLAACAAHPADAARRDTASRHNRTFAAPVPDTATFVTTLGDDTIAVERYRRAGTALVGDIVLRAPVTVLYHYAITFRPGGGMERSVVDLTEPGAPDGPRYRTTIAVDGGTARIAVDSSGVVKTYRRSVPADIMPGLMTGFGSDYGLYISLGIYQADAATVGPALGVVTDVPVLDVASGELSTKHLVRRNPTDVDVDYFRIAWTRLGMDARGRIDSANASGTTEKTLSARTGPMNVDSVVAAFARRDREGESVGQLSPPASAAGRIGAASVTIRYNSPRRRGRVILGATVPYGQVWRTGADAATELTVDRPVIIGGKRIPAGTYTLWTIPEPDRATLIINGQYGQWGTDYDSTRDVARVPMRVARGRPVREDFTISLAGGGAAQVLRMAWGGFVWTVPVSAP